MEFLEVVYCGRSHLRGQVRSETRSGLSQGLTTKHITEKNERQGHGAVKKENDRANKGEEGGEGKRTRERHKSRKRTKSLLG